MTALGVYYLWAGVSQDYAFQRASVVGRVVFAAMGLYGVRRRRIHPVWQTGFIVDVVGAFITFYFLQHQ